MSNNAEIKLRISKDINYRFLVINVPNILNIVIPLILVPIVIESYGIEEFGNVVFYQGVIGILLIISENGLNTISLAELRNNSANRVVFHTIIIKLITAVVLLLIVAFLIPKDDIVLFLCLFMSVFGQALNVSYLYIFKQNETVYSILSLAIKLLGLAFFLLFSERGILMYVLFLGISDFLLGLGSLILCGSFMQIIFVRLNVYFLKILLKRGVDFAKIQLLSSGYTTSLPIYLKLFGGLQMVGIYGAVERIYRGFSNLSAPFNLILLGERKFESLSDFFEMKQVKLFFVGFILVLSLFGWKADYIMPHLLPDVKFDTYKFSFYISLITPIIVFFSRAYVVNFYIKLALENQLVPIYLHVFLLSIPIYILGINFFGLIGCITGALLVEILCLIFLRHNYTNSKT